MRYVKKSFFVGIVFLIFLISFCSGLSMTKSELKALLKGELDRYFINKTNDLNTTELRELLDFYHKTRNNFDTNNISLSSNVKEFLEGSLNISKINNTNNQNLSLLKKFGQKCKNDTQCESGRCVKKGYFIFATKKCSYASNKELGLKSAGGKCKEDLDCESRKCKCSIFCLRKTCK